MALSTLSRKAADGSIHRKQRLVQETAARLRDLILAQEPETQIGSLTEVAQLLNVGIVTVQQAARILEHEGLLTVRRGPRGGYYGTRPDGAALERMLGAYMRVHGFGRREALEMLTFLDCEIIPAAARSDDEASRARMRALHERIGQCNSPEMRIDFETELRDLLFQMVARPLIEFLSRASTHQRAGMNPSDAGLFAGETGVIAWKLGKQRILQAILSRDEDLARFEAERYRQEVMLRLRTTEQQVS